MLRTGRLVLLSTVTGIVIASLIYVGVTRSRQERETKPTRELPAVESHIERLEIVSKKLKGKERPDTVVEIEVRNNSDKPVIAFTVESGTPEDAAGITVNGFNDGDVPPTVVIEPHGSKTVLFPLSNVKPGFPIKISGVMYEDGTQDGEEATLETVRGQKEHYKAKKIKANN